MWSNPQFLGDLVTFTEENSLMENFIFCAVDILHKLFLLIRPLVII